MRVPQVVEVVVSSVLEPVHRITVALPSNTPVVIADADRLEQVVSNLLDNARKYSPVGSEITISGAVTDRGYELSVSDQGKGIEPEFLPHLFEPFTQADTGDTRRDHGVGLGLSICHGLVEAMGGTLEVTSTPSVGSTFTIVLTRIVPTPTEPLETAPVTSRPA